MKKKTIAIMMSLVLTVAMLAGCGEHTLENTVGNEITAGNGKEFADVENEAAAVEQTEQEQEEAGAAQQGQEEPEAAQKTDNGSGEGEPEAAQKTDNGSGEGEPEAVRVRIGSLKGPTSMGLVYLMDQAQKKETADDYEFTMAAAADELLPAMLSGELDLVLIPANVASILYMKTEGGVSVIDINTLGVLYMVSGDDTIQSMEDLKGKTVYLTGKGTTPDYVLQYLLKESGMTAADIELEYKSEATEVAAMLAERPDAAGVLPQPFATAACMQNEELSEVLDLTAQWAAVQEEGGSRLVTGVTVVRSGFLAEHEDAVVRFLAEHAASAAYANEHVEEAAQLVAAAGIIEKAPVAVTAMPKCNITYIDGEDMKAALSGYLKVLCEQDAASVGGGLPGDDFYYNH